MSEVHPNSNKVNALKKSEMKFRNLYVGYVLSGLVLLVIILLARNRYLNIEMRLKIQVLSDLHIELLKPHEKLPDIPVVSEILVLAGDIGDPFKESFEEYISDVASKYKLVFLVIGNHEFYGHTIEETLLRTTKICDSFENVFFMHKKTYLLSNKLRLIGCTLWSEIPKEAEDDVHGTLNDYMLIRIKKKVEEESGINRTYRRLHVSDTKKFFKDELRFLESELSKAKKNREKVIVVTHHAPLFSGCSDPKFDGSKVNHAFQSDLRRLVKKPVVGWVSGHTHYSSKLKLNGIPVVSNQLGYTSESCGFNASYALQISY